MLCLGTPANGWMHLLPGVRVQFAPIGIKAVRKARVACGLALEADGDDHQEALDALSRELIRRGVVAWEGIGDPDGDEIAPSTLVTTPLGDMPAIELFLDNPDTFEAAYRLYVAPWLERDTEKNASGASSNGISEGATPESDTASSAAVRTPAGAKSAPTSGTKPKRTKANSPSK